MKNNENMRNNEERGRCENILGNETHLQVNLRMKKKNSSISTLCPLQQRGKQNTYCQHLNSIEEAGNIKILP